MITIKRLVVLVFLLSILSTGVSAGRRNIDIIEVSHPQMVARGEEFSVQVTVMNRGDHRENVTVTGEALRQKSESKEKIIKSREKEEFNLTFTPRMDAEGPFKISIEAESPYSYDHFTVKSQVSKIEGYFNIRPEQPKVNSPVRIKGRLEHTGIGEGVRHLSAELYEGTRYLGKVETDENGYFSTEFTPKRVGSHRLRLVKDDVLLERSIYVEPSVRVSKGRRTQEIFEESYAEKCFNIKLNGLEKAVLMQYDTTDEEKLIKEKIIDRHEAEECLRIPTDKAGQKRGRIIVESEDGKYSDRIDFSYMVGQKRLEVEHKRENIRYQNGEIIVPIEIINRRQEDLDLRIRVDTDLDILERPSPVKIKGDSSKVVDLRFGGGTGTHQVNLKVSSARDEVSKTLEVDAEKKNANFTGLITMAETGLRVLVVILLVIGVISASKYFLAPKALEPKY